MVDVEATGLSTEWDEVVQLAILPCTYDAQSGLVFEILKGEAFDGLRESSVSMTTDTSIIIGILDDDLTGKEIDSTQVKHFASIQKKPPQRKAKLLILLVAGVGFEPTTFRL